MVMTGTMVTTVLSNPLAWTKQQTQFIQYPNCVHGTNLRMYSDKMALVNPPTSQKLLQFMVMDVDIYLSSVYISYTSFYKRWNDMCTHAFPQPTRYRGPAFIRTAYVTGERAYMCQPYISAVEPVVAATQLVSCVHGCSYPTEMNVGSYDYCALPAGNPFKVAWDAMKTQGNLSHNQIMAVAETSHGHCLLPYLGASEILMHSECTRAIGRQCYNDICVLNRSKGKGFTNQNPTARKRKIFCNFATAKHSIQGTMFRAATPQMAVECQHCYLKGLVMGKLATNYAIAPSTAEDELLMKLKPCRELVVMLSPDEIDADGFYENNEERQRMAADAILKFLRAYPFVTGVVLNNHGAKGHIDSWTNIMTYVQQSAMFFRANVSVGLGHPMTTNEKLYTLKKTLDYMHYFFVDLKRFGPDYKYDQGELNCISHRDVADATGKIQTTQGQIEMALKLGVPEERIVVVVSHYGIGNAGDFSALSGYTKQVPFTYLDDAGLSDKCDDNPASCGYCHFGGPCPVTGPKATKCDIVYFSFNQMKKNVDFFLKRWPAVNFALADVHGDTADMKMFKTVRDYVRDRKGGIDTSVTYEDKNEYHYFIGTGPLTYCPYILRSNGKHHVVTTGQAKTMRIPYTQHYITMTGYNCEKGIPLPSVMCTSAASTNAISLFSMRVSTDINETRFDLDKNCFIVPRTLTELHSAKNMETATCPESMVKLPAVVPSFNVLSTNYTDYIDTEHLWVRLDQVVTVVDSYTDVLEAMNLKKVCVSINETIIHSCIDVVCGYDLVCAQETTLCESEKQLVSSLRRRMSQYNSLLLDYMRIVDDVGYFNGMATSAGVKSTLGTEAAMHNYRINALKANPDTFVKYFTSKMSNETNIGHAKDTVHSINGKATNYSMATYRNLKMDVAEVMETVGMLEKMKMRMAELKDESGDEMNRDRRSSQWRFQIEMFMYGLQDSHDKLYAIIQKIQACVDSLRKGTLANCPVNQDVCKLHPQLCNLVPNVYGSFFTEELLMFVYRVPDKYMLTSIYDIWAKPIRIQGMVFVPNTNGIAMVENVYYERPMCFQGVCDKLKVASQFTECMNGIKAKNLNMILTFCTLDACEDELCLNVHRSSTEMTINMEDIVVTFDVPTTTSGPTTTAPVTKQAMTTSSNGIAMTDAYGKPITVYIKQLIQVDGKLMKDMMGNPVTVMYKQVTDVNGTAVTDKQGNAVTMYYDTVPDMSYDKMTTSPPKKTVTVVYRTVTKKDGEIITDEMKNPVTIRYQTVTDRQRKLVTDNYGNPVTLSYQQVTDRSGNDVTDQHGKSVTLLYETVRDASGELKMENGKPVTKMYRRVTNGVGEGVTDGSKIAVTENVRTVTNVEGKVVTDMYGNPVTFVENVFVDRRNHLVTDHKNMSITVPYKTLIGGDGNSLLDTNGVPITVPYQLLIDKNGSVVTDSNNKILTLAYQLVTDANGKMATDLDGSAITVAYQTKTDANGNYVTDVNGTLVTMPSEVDFVTMTDSYGNAYTDSAGNPLVMNNQLNETKLWDEFWRNVSRNNPSSRSNFLKNITTVRDVVDELGLDTRLRIFFNPVVIGCMMFVQAVEGVGLVLLAVYMYRHRPNRAYSPIPTY